MKSNALIRIAGFVVLVLIVEWYARAGFVPKLILVPPSAMFMGMINLVHSPRIASDVIASLISIVTAAIGAIFFGFIAGAIIHRLPRVRRVMDPLLTTYNSIPIFVFYPLFIVFLGLGNAPKIAIAFLFGFVIMIINTLNGLDRVPKVYGKTARVMQLNSVTTNMMIIVPSSLPYVFNGVKFAVAYAVTGVIGSEFILSSSGIGYQIGVTFNNFDTVKMYGLILLVLLIVVVVNGLLFSWEQAFINKRRAS
jgi:NitT/TauT family transport system permease protein